MFSRKFMGWRLVLPLAALVLAFSFSGWADNHDELSQVRQAIKDKKAKWVAGETSISKLPLEERKKRLGVRKPKTREEEEIAAAAAPLLRGSETPVAALAATLDWRSYPGGDLPAGSYVTAVRNQKSCASCWAFATTAALESSVLFANKTPNQQYDFSEQVLVSCANDPDPGGCGGGYITTASSYIRDTGLPVESCFLYTAQDTPCIGSYVCPEYEVDTTSIQSWSYVATISPTVEGIKNALATYGPLVTTFDVYSDFYNYRTGIYKYVSGTYQGGHAVLIVGYNDPDQCFIVKNSWGTGWGESGFFKIAYSELNSAVDFGDYTLAYVGEGATPPPPPPPTCTFTISPTSKTFKAAGGSSSVSVTATASTCPWSVVNSLSWVTTTSGASGTGTGRVNYTVAANTTSLTRTGTMTIAGKPFTVKQSGTRTRPTNGGGKK